MNIISIFSRQQQDNTPGGLAAELAEANRLAAERIAAAEAEQKAARDSVVERGVQRQQELAALAAEIEQEREDLANVLNKA